MEIKNLDNSMLAVALLDECNFSCIHCSREDYMYPGYKLCAGILDMKHTYAISVTWLCITDGTLLQIDTVSHLLMLPHLEASLPDAETAPSGDKLDMTS